MILALALLVLQERDALSWAELPLPPAALAPPSATLPPALLPGGHLSTGSRRSSPFRRSEQAQSPRLGLAELTGLLEEEARLAGEPLTVVYGAPPLLAGGTPGALERARSTCRALAAKSSVRVELEAWLSPAAAAQGEPGPVSLPAGSPRPAGVPWRASAVPGRPVFLGDRHEQEFLASYDVEVATGASVADPVPGLASTGNSLHLAAWPVEGGAAVFVEGLLDLSELVGMEEFQPQSGDLGLLQRARVASVQLRFAGRLENGGRLRLWVRGAPLTQRDWTLELAARLSSEPRAAGAWTAVDLGFLAAQPDASALVLPASLGGTRPSELASAALLQPLAPAALWGRVAPQLSRGGRSLARTVGEFAVVPSDDAATLERLQALLFAAEAARTRTSLLTVELGELRAGLPVAAGRPAGVAAGTESMRLADYDVEIAQESWIGSPEVVTDFEGLALGGVLSEGGFRYAWSRAELTPPQRLEPLDTAHGRLDLSGRVRSAGTGRAAGSVESARAPGEPRLELFAVDP